jgi:hypothetical protein
LLPLRLASACRRLPSLFEPMVYHTDRGRRLALNSPLLLPERVPVAILKEFDQAV